MGNLTHTVSGGIASFRSAARIPIESLKCHFLPKLDLHGYSDPWIGGGGKNLFNKDDSTSIVTGLNIDTIDNIKLLTGSSKATFVYIPCLPNTTYTASKIATARSAIGYVTTLPPFSAGNVIYGYVNFNNATSATTTTGNDATYLIVYINNGAYDDTPLLNILDSLLIEIGTSATYYVPYENICPIEGWNNLTVTICKKNLFDKNNTVSGYISAVTTATRSLGEIVPSDAWHTSDYIKVEPLAVYTLSIPSITNASVAGIVLFSEKQTGNEISGISIEKMRLFQLSYTFTIPLNCKYIRFAVSNVTINVAQFEKNNLATNYEPYNENIIPITLPNVNKNKLPIGTVSFTQYKKYVLDKPLPPGTYTISATVTSSDTDSDNLSLILFEYAGENEKSHIFKYLSRNTRNSQTLTIYRPCSTVYIYASTGYVESAGDTATWTDVLLEVGTSMTGYEPYEFNNIVYGGYVDIAKGEVVAEWIKVKKKLSQYTAKREYNNGIVFYNYNDFSDIPCYASGIVTSTINSSNSKCSIAPHTWAMDNLAKNHYYIYKLSDTNKTRLLLYLLKDSVKSEELEFEIAFRLETPIHYPMIKLELTSFLDSNHYWSSANDITDVSYLVHDSNMIQLAKKNIMAENNTHYKKVLWNLWLPPLDSDNWQVYNTNYATVTFNDGVGKNTWLVNDRRGYNTSICTKSTIPITANEIWYVSYMLRPSKNDLDWGIEFAGGLQKKCLDNVGNTSWVQCSTTGTQYNGATILKVYIGNCRSNNEELEIGMYAENTAPILINLTSMFGIGNEPTKEEFEYLCKINNIDLTTYHPIDTGTEQIWCIPDHNTNEYTTVEWNQNAKPINSSNYKAYNSEHIAVTFEDDVLVSTWLTDGSEYSWSACSNYSKVHALNHYYYLSYEYYTDIDGYIGGDVGGVTTNYVQTQTNVWTRYSTIVERTSGGNFSNYAVYVNRFSKYCNPVAGNFCKVRNIVAMDLTLMFGTGNELLTVEELLATCLKNNINLNETLPYNTGTKMIWKV